MERQAETSVLGPGRVLLASRTFGPPFSSATGENGGPTCDGIGNHPGGSLIGLQPDARKRVLLKGRRLDRSITLLNLDQALTGQRGDALTEYDSPLSQDGDSNDSL
jgi:hypothetical protein